MNRNRFGGVFALFMTFVATLSSFVGNREIKPNNKTKEEIVEGFSLISGSHQRRMPRFISARKAPSFLFTFPNMSRSPK